MSFSLVISSRFASPLDRGPKLHHSCFRLLASECMPTSDSHQHLLHHTLRTRSIRKWQSAVGTDAAGYSAGKFNTMWGRDMLPFTTPITSRHASTLFTRQICRSTPQRYESTPRRRHAARSVQRLQAHGATTHACTFGHRYHLAWMK
jgi:hypothetical protein